MKNEDDFEPLVQKGDCSISNPVSYSFRFNHCGWAIFTLNDATGEFSIQSDWGNYSYRWSRGGLDKESLTSFIQTASPDYITDKFSYENRQLQRVFDGAATKKGVIETVRERMGGLDNEDRKALGLDLRTVLVFDEEIRDFMDSIERTEVAHRFLNHEDIRTKDCARHRFLVKQLLPFFQQYLKQRASAASAENAR